MAVSEDLFQIAGFFERYAKTGGLFSAGEAKFLMAKLGSLAEATRALEIGHQEVCREFDQYIETSGAPVDRRPVRAFGLLQGGRP